MSIAITINHYRNSTIGHFISLSFHGIHFGLGRHIHHIWTLWDYITSVEFVRVYALYGICRHSGSGAYCAPTFVLKKAKLLATKLKMSILYG